MMLKHLFTDLRKYFRYTVFQARAILKTEVANSYLNWLWWILDPLCMMLVYAFVFGTVFNTKEPHYSVFIFIGLTMWNFFNKTTLSSIKLIKQNHALVSRIYFPKYILLIIKIWVNGFKMLVSFGVVVLMLFIDRITITWNFLFFFPIIFALALITFGCCCFLMHYGVYIEDLSNLMNVVLRLFFYLTGVFYNIRTKIPEYGIFLAKLNPIAFLIDAMRQCVIYGNVPDCSGLLTWSTIGAILSLCGIYKIYKSENDYVKAI